MKVLVAVKRVIDPYVRVRVKADQSGVETLNIKMAMNPFDEIALEEALRFRERHEVSEVIAVSIGSDSVQETLRHALAMGADRAILIRTETQFESLNIAKILKKIVEKENPSLVLMGKQTIDGDNNQTPQMLSTLLNWPQVTYASKIELNELKINVTREIDGGLETLQTELPAIISTDLRLNEPRYATLPNIMKAKRKTLELIELSTLSLNLKSHLVSIKTQAPPARNAGIKVNSVAELINKLKYEAKIL